MILRPYQERFINNIAAKLRIHRKVVAQLATGGGKTVCFSAICVRFCAKSSQDILILVHREELLLQASKAIKQPTQQVVAGMRTIPPARVYVAMVESAYKRLHQFTNIGMVIVDECHRSIYGLWRGVIEYFDAHIIGLTATPTKQTLGFFQQNLVSEYTFPQSVADKVNVDFEVYRIRTKISEKGATIEAGTVVPVLDKRTREQRLLELDNDIPYTSNELDRSVVSKRTRVKPPNLSKR